MSPSLRPSLPPRRLTSEEASWPGLSVTITRDDPLWPARSLRILSSFSRFPELPELPELPEWPELPERPDLAITGPPSPTTRASASAALVRLRCHRITIAVSFRFRYLPQHLRERARSCPTDTCRVPIGSGDPNPQRRTVADGAGVVPRRWLAVPPEDLERE